MPRFIPIRGRGAAGRDPARARFARPGREEAAKPAGRRRRAAGIVLAAALLAWGPAANAEGIAPGGGPPVASPRRIDAAIARAAAFLRGRIGPDGRVEGEFAQTDKFHGGRTALCAYALATAGVRGDDPALRRAMGWLSQAKLRSVYAVSLRACALAAGGEPNTLAVLKEDVRWLVSAASGDGRYTYESLGGKASATFDNSNAHAAMMGVAAGASRGVEVPPDYWRRMERYWLDQQQFDGGWGYRTIPGSRQVKTYGSMTAGGLEGLLICFDVLRRADFAACREVPQYKPVEDGLSWLERAFSAEENPGIGENRYYSWLYGISRVGRAAGYKYIGPHDWYALCASEILPRQDPSGTWGEGPDLADTCFAVMFLASGRHGVLVSKLRYAGRWNARPGDLAHLADWMSRTFERPVTWQIVEANSPLEDLCEAPVLYISGAGPIDLSPGQVDRLRLFVQRGGMILSEAACGSGDFTQDMQRLLRRIFPQYPLQQLAPDHPVYTAHFAPRAQAGLMGAWNGVRLLAVHAPRELSLGLQLGAEGANQAWFELSANIVFQATDKAPIPPRGERAWPVAAGFEPRATVRVARLRHGGNCDPEPLAWERLSAAVGAEHRLRLEVSPLMGPASLEATRWPLAAMTGSADPNWGPGELEALRQYLLDGGTLLVDAAGGSRPFGRWVEKELLPLLPGAAVGPVDLLHPLLRGPVAIDRVAYRRNYADALGRGASQPNLITVHTGEGRLAILFSPDDLTAALVGYGGYNIRGYTPDCARKILTNLLWEVALSGMQPTTRASTTAPAPSR